LTYSTPLRSWTTPCSLTSRSSAAATGSCTTTSTTTARPRSRVELRRMPAAAEWESSCCKGHVNSVGEALLYCIGNGSVSLSIYQ
jgi:hypothetical protein